MRVGVDVLAVAVAAACLPTTLTAGAKLPRLHTEARCVPLRQAVFLRVALTLFHV